MSEEDKGGLGNFKGVMLCNRPMDNINKKQQSDGPVPFYSRVDPKENLGVNPVKKNLPYEFYEKPLNNNNILLRHKKWLRELSRLKANERNYQDENEKQKLNLKDRIKLREANKRLKIRTLRKDENEKIEEEQNNNKKDLSVSKLTEKNLSEFEKESEVPKHKKHIKSKKKKEKPAWARSEEENIKKEEEDDEKEAKSLIEYAESLDYDKQVDDFEVKAAMNAVKDNVKKISETEDWKKFVNDQNKKDEDALSDISESRQITKKSPIPYNQKNDDNISVGSRASSIATSKIEEAIDKLENESQPNWDKISNINDKERAKHADKLAKLVADKVLHSNLRLKEIHSNKSIRKILENEAKKNLIAAMREKVTEPKIITIEDKNINQGSIRCIKEGNTSNLPYLHRNPAI